MSRVSKKEDLFYRLLQDFSQKVADAGDIYYQIIEGYPESVSRIPEMKQIEVECDDKMKNLLVELYKSFITPFDREDIAALVNQLDDVVDDMEHIVRRFDLYHVSAERPEALELAACARDATKELKVMFDVFPTFKKDSGVIKQTKKIHDIEDKADDVYHAAIGRLYNETDATATHLLKWNTLFNRMEDCVDACKGVATIAGNVVLKNA